MQFSSWKWGSLPASCEQTSCAAPTSATRDPQSSPGHENPREFNEPEGEFKLQTPERLSSAAPRSLTGKGSTFGGLQDIFRAKTGLEVVVSLHCGCQLTIRTSAAPLGFLMSVSSVLGPQQTIQDCLIKWSGPNTRAQHIHLVKKQEKVWIWKSAEQTQALLLQPQQGTRFGITGSNQMTEKWKQSLEELESPVPIPIHSGESLWFPLMQTGVESGLQYEPALREKAALLLDMTPVVQSESQLSFAFSRSPSK